MNKVSVPDDFRRLVPANASIAWQTNHRRHGREIVQIILNIHTMKTNDELRKDVMEQISWTPELRSVATEIGVAAKDGVITLTGTVDSYWKKVAAENAAQKVSGVKVVASDVIVKLAGGIMRTDTEIAQAVRNALRWNSAVDDDSVDVKVDGGWVSLSGQVDWRFQKDSIQRSVENLTGVVGVSNAITLKARPIDTKQIKGKITAAFHRSATLDAAAITIDATGATVNLKGRVRSWAEKKEAESIALAAPGVISVENQIDVDPAIFV
jgi:osmotically-inducible protein OsmY